MGTIDRELQELELALLRRGVGELVAERVRCDRCQRTPLIGERMYVYAAGAVLCELCRTRESSTPSHADVVHGPEFGHTLRIIDRRRAA
jgi:hypothetical protein